MKAIFKTLGKFLMTVALLCPTVTFAHDYDPAHWVSDINDTVRLCNLSIPEAHDAATWFTDNYLAKDQKYDEKKLFSMGVRSFDMRFRRDLTSQNGLIKYLFDKDYVFAHGIFSLNTIKDEIENHFPSPEDLEGEFMVLSFQYEIDDMDLASKFISTGNDVLAFQKFIDCLVAKYDPNLDKDMFIPFRKDLTVKDVRGKIILIATGNGYNPSKLTRNKVPVALVHTGEKVYKETYSDGSIEAFPADYDGDKIKSTNDAIFFEQNSYEVKCEEKKKAIKIGLEGDDTGKFEGWFQYLERTNNKDCVFHKTQINSYSLPQRGVDICSDYDVVFGISRISLTSNIGCNHYTYDLLNKHNGKPFGFVRFDFIGCGGVYYGDKLLKLILDNNDRYFMSEEELAKKREKQRLDEIIEILESYGYYGYYGDDYASDIIIDDTEIQVKEPLTRAGDFEDEVFNDSDDDNLPADVQPILYNDGNMLYVENCDDNAIFNVYDVSGKVVAHATTAPIEISHLKKGIYVLDINGKGYKFVKK